MKIDAKPHMVLRTLLQALARATGLPEDAVAALLGRPPKPEMGDYAFPCFAFAKAAKMPPPAAAAQLAEKLRADAALTPLLLKADTAGAFLNISIKPGVLSASIIESILGAGGAYGESRAGVGKTIVIDYSGPNIAKPFHVGHLMSTILGAALARIFRAQGYTVVGVNHLGDWGVQCGFQFLAWQKEKEKFARGEAPDPEKELAASGLDYLCDLYVEINSAAREVNALEAELVLVAPDDRARIKARLDAVKPEADANDAQARALFKRLEDGDAELKALWERLRKQTLEYLQKSYDRLGVKFESDAGEGFYEPLLKPLLKQLKDSGVAVESEGALVVPMDDAPATLHPTLSQEGRGDLSPLPSQGRGRGRGAETTAKKKPPFILLKSDEATIYGTRDLAAALYRKQTYDFHKNLYVVDVRQSQHFQMLFKTLEKMGHAWAADCAHVSFGLMQIKEGDAVLAMTTRGGRMVPLSELLDRMVGVVRQIVREKNADLPAEKAAQVEEAVGVGAIVFWVLARRRASNFVFDWAQATDPRGDTGPYLQFTHARTCGILRKSLAAPEFWKRADFTWLAEPEELAVARALEGFPAAVAQAAEDYEPSLISSHLLDLSSAFGNFLNKHRVLESPEGLREARLALVYCVRQTLARGLGLLGVAAPEEM